MTMLIFLGDLLVMAFMIAVVVWVSLATTREKLDASARIPLDDEADHG